MRTIILAALAIAGALAADAWGQNEQDLVRACTPSEGQVGRVLSVDLANARGRAYLVRPSLPFRVPLQGQCSLQRDDRIIADNATVAYEHCGARETLTNGEALMGGEACPAAEALRARRGGSVAQNDTPQSYAQARGAQERAWTGYAARFEELRPDLERGDFATALLSSILTNEAQRSHNDTALTELERATLSLDSGAPREAATLFAVEQAPQGRIGQRLRSMASNNTRFAGFLLGRADVSPYHPRGGEDVLRLNYLTLSQLMAGHAHALHLDVAPDARPANSAPWAEAIALRDNTERERTEARERALERIVQLRVERPRTAETEIAIAAAYATPDRCPASHTAPGASAAPDALSEYLGGLALELSSTRYPEDRPAAHAYFAGAATRAPSALVLRQAAGETSTATRPPGRLVNIVVSEGFAPTRQSVPLTLTQGAEPIHLNVARLTCHRSDVARLEVRSSQGRRLARFDLIADVERAMLHDQQLREPMVTLGILSDLDRAAIESEALQSAALFSALMQVRHYGADVRSWSSLPARFYAARFNAPLDTSQVEIVALDARGRVIARQTATLDQTAPQNLIYGRVTNSTVTTSSASLWIRERQ